MILITPWWIKRKLEGIVKWPYECVKEINWYIVFYKLFTDM